MYINVPTYERMYVFMHVRLYVFHFQFIYCSKNKHYITQCTNTFWRYKGQTQEWTVQDLYLCICVCIYVGVHV